MLILTMPQRNSAYWSARQRKQGGRALAKGIKAYGNPSVKSVASAAWSGVKYLRSLVNSEVMKYDIVPATTTISTSPTLLMNLTAIAQGDGTNQRTGNSILNSGFYVNLQCTKASAATFSTMRIVVVQDLQQIADTTPGWSDIFENTSTFAKVSSDTMSRFKILYDKRICLSVSNDSRLINIYRKFHNVHTRYNGSATTDIQKNGIYVLMISSETVNVPSVLYTGRTYFHDN